MLCVYGLDRDFVYTFRIVSSISHSCSRSTVFVCVLLLIVCNIIVSVVVTKMRLVQRKMYTRIHRYRDEERVMLTGMMYCTLKALSIYYMLHMEAATTTELDTHKNHEFK